MSEEKSDVTRRDSNASDFSPGDNLQPLDETFKPSSTRARFEELVRTYRTATDRNGRTLSKFDYAMEKRSSIFHLIELAKGGELPRTQQIVNTVHNINFDKMRAHTTTFQGKKVIDHLENATNSGANAFEEINGEDDMQIIINDLDNVRKETVDDRKELARKAKQGTSSSKETANIAGSDFLVLAKGVGTSSTFRKAFADLFNLLNDAVQNKKPEEIDTSDSLVDRMRNLIVEVRANPDVRKSLSSLHGLYTLSYRRGSRAANNATEQLKDHPANKDLSDARSHAKKLFTKLGNGYDLSTLISTLSAIGAMSRNNEGFSKLMDDVKDFGDWSLNVDSDELTSDEFKTRSQDIIDQSQHVLSDDERKQFSVLSEEFANYMHAIRENPVLVDYKNSMTELMHSIMGYDLGIEERHEHYRALRQDMLTNLPILIQAIRYAPLPRIAGQNKDIEFAADNIVLDLKRFVPEHISFAMHSEIYPRASVFKKKSAALSDRGFNGEQFFYMTITGIHFVAKRVAFYIKKKRGLPRLAEKGIADFLVHERGMDLVVRLRKLHNSEKPQVSINESTASAKANSKIGESSSESARTRAARELDIVDVKVKLHNLDIRVRENKHNISSTLALALMRPIARKLIARNIAKSLTENLVQGDKILAKYSSTAEGFMMENSKKAMTSAKGAAKKGAQKSKDQINKIGSKSKAKNSQKETPRRDSLVEVSESAPQSAV
ncbi:hypothetical protein H4S08_004524 [Coemansia sp. RSA 1365]|nr:hypothetical protein H4S08_004524 [Coemansia sp. RSA 1365]